MRIDWHRIRNDGDVTHSALLPDGTKVGEASLSTRDRTQAYIWDWRATIGDTERTGRAASLTAAKQAVEEAVEVLAT